MGQSMFEDLFELRAIPGLAEILAQHGGGSGVAFAWEIQLHSAQNIMAI
jgi:hypothetical protein